MTGKAPSTKHSLLKCIAFSSISCQGYFQYTCEVKKCLHEIGKQASRKTTSRAFQAFRRVQMLNANVRVSFFLCVLVLNICTDLGNQITPIQRKFSPPSNYFFVTLVIILFALTSISERHNAVVVSSKSLSSANKAPFADFLCQRLLHIL